MHTVSQLADLRRQVESFKREGLRVGFVPTMGALHEGHLSLVAEARLRSDRVVVSIFVNPTQFGPGEDLDRYPRTPQQDAAQLTEAGCDLLWMPEVETLYPPGEATRVVLSEAPGSPAFGLEAVARPGHFEGVATVVAKLLVAVAPDVAVFGEKDAQQLAVVRRLVRDLLLPVEIVGSPTVREADGLAMSSRNRYLSPEERRAAVVLSRALDDARQAIAQGERSGDRVRAILHRRLAGEPLGHVDYADVVDAETFEPIDQLQGRIVLPLVVRFGTTRLLDNLHLDLATEGRERSPRAQISLNIEQPASVSPEMGT